jgi:hypothetical protein
MMGVELSRLVWDTLLLAVEKEAFQVFFVGGDSRWGLAFATAVEDVALDQGCQTGGGYEILRS